MTEPNNYKVEFTGLRINESLLSDKGVGYFRRVGRTYTERVVIPVHPSIEPTVEHFYASLRMTEPNYEIDINSIKFSLQ